MSTDARAPLGDYSVHFGLNEYFQNSVTAINPRGHKVTVAKTTPRTQLDGNLLLLVRAGAGTISINNEVLPLRRGSFLCLGPFHNYAIAPDPDRALELSLCQMDCGAYMYILSCPYIKVREFVVPQPPAVAQISEADTRRIEKIFDEICAETESDYYSEKLRFLCVMELMGVLMSKMDGSRMGRRYDPTRGGQAEGERDTGAADPHFSNYDNDF